MEDRGDERRENRGIVTALIRSDRCGRHGDELDQGRGGREAESRVAGRVRRHVGKSEIGLALGNLDALSASLEKNSMRYVPSGRLLNRPWMVVPAPPGAIEVSTGKFSSLFGPVVLPPG